MSCLVFQSFEGWRFIQVFGTEVCLEAEDLHRSLWSLGVAQLPPKGVVSEKPGVWLRSWVEDCSLCLCALEPPPGAGSESVWQIRTFRTAGQDLLGLPSYGNINPIHLSTHLLIVSLLKMFNVKVTFEIRDVSKIMDYGMYVCGFCLWFYFLFLVASKEESVCIKIFFWEFISRMQCNPEEKKLKLDEECLHWSVGSTVVLQSAELTERRCWANVLIYKVR